MFPDLFNIIKEPVALFTLVIAVGFILIIIAAVPSLSVFLLKNAGFTLNKRQSITVAAIGVVLVVIGSVGILVLSQLEAAPIGEVFIDPASPVTITNETPLKISVVIKDSNLAQKIFDDPEGIKFTFSILDSNGPDYYVWEGKYNHSQFNLSPEDAGKKTIWANVTDISKNREYTIGRTDYNIILPPNKPPMIKNVSYKPKAKGKGIEIKVDAVDPDDIDEIYYDFKLISLSPYSVSPILPPSDDYRENSRVLTLGKNDTGEKVVRVYIRDGSKKELGPYMDRVPVFDEKWDIII